MVLPAGGATNVRLLSQLRWPWSHKTKPAAGPMIRLPSFSFCKRNFLHHLVHRLLLIISTLQEKVLSVPCSPAREDQQATLPVGGADRRRQRLLHCGSWRHLRGRPQRVEVQLSVLARAWTGDHARHLVPRHQLAARRLRACRSDRGGAYQEVHGPQDGRLHLGPDQPMQEGSDGEFGGAGMSLGSCS